MWGQTHNGGWGAAAAPSSGAAAFGSGGGFGGFGGFGGGGGFGAPAASSGGFSGFGAPAAASSAGSGLGLSSGGSAPFGIVATNSSRGFALGTGFGSGGFAFGGSAAGTGLFGAPTGAAANPQSAPKPATAPGSPAFSFGATNSPMFAQAIAATGAGFPAFVQPSAAATGFPMSVFAPQAGIAPVGAAALPSGLFGTPPPAPAVTAGAVPPSLPPLEVLLARDPVSNLYVTSRPA